MADGMEKIEHLVILMMENRSFDHYLGSLTLEGRADVDGLTDPPPTNPQLDGTPVPAWSLEDWDVAHKYSGYDDPPHGPGPQTASYDNGNNDGFVQQFQTKYPNDDGGKAPANLPMGYYTRQTLPVLYALADNFTVCDRWFCSLLSSTWPNRKYLNSGIRDNDEDTQTIPGLFGFQTTPFYTVLENTLNPTTGNRYTWKCYFSDLPFLAFWYKFAATHALDNFTGVDTFVTDCREDRLPTVSIIDPPFSLADDHPTHDVRLGQKFIGLIVDALTNSNSWQKSALVLLYDENGGFFDHVPPPASFEVQAGLPPSIDNPLGFRVPAVVISPYSLRGQACHTAFDHTSLMASISKRWNIPFDPAVFGTRFQHAPDIWTDCFDFTQEPLDQGIYTQAAPGPAPFQDLHWGSRIHELMTNPIGSLEAVLERLFLLPELKTLDQRAKVFDHLQALEQNVITLKRMNQVH